MRKTRSLQWVSMATATLTSVWFVPSLLDPFNIPKLAILVVGAAALLGLLCGVTSQWFNKSQAAMLGPIVLFVVGLSAAGVAGEQNLYRTLWGAWARNDGWLAYSSLAIIALAVAVAFRGRDVRIGLYALVATGYVQVMYGLVQTTGNDPVKWNNGYNAILGTVGNPNFASALLGISAVAMVWVAIEPETRFEFRILNAVFALLAAFLTVRSESIQGTLSFGAGIAVLMAAWISDGARPAQVRRLLRPYMAVGVIAAALGIWGLTGGGPLGSVLFSQNLVNRTYYWRAGWRMFQQNPMFGVGLDSFGDWYRLVRLPEQVAATGAQTVTNAAHSIVFQLMATGGLAVFGSFVIFQVAVVWRGTIALRSGEDRLLVGALWGIWTAFFLQSLFSIDQLGLTVWGWVNYGLLLGVSKPAPQKSKPGAVLSRKRRGSATNSSTSWLPYTLAGVLALAGSSLVARPLGTESNLSRILSFTYDANKPNLAAQSEIKQALLKTVNEAQEPYWRAAAVNKLFQIGSIEDGITLAQESARQFPMDVTLWNLAAIGLEQTARSSQATKWRERTVYLDPLNDEFRKLLELDKSAES